LARGKDFSPERLHSSLLPIAGRQGNIYHSYGLSIAAPGGGGAPGVFSAHRQAPGNKKLDIRQEFLKV
jgi:hypothetical protein